MEKTEWKDALGNDIEVGTVYGTAYKNNGCNYPIFYYVYELTEVDGWRDNKIPKVKVIANSERHEKVRRQTIEVLNCLFPVNMINENSQAAFNLWNSDLVKSVKNSYL